MSIGRIVIYNTTQLDRDFFSSTYSNTPARLPAIVVAVWSDECVNLKVIGDGHHDLWKTSIMKGDSEGQWNWPVINK